MFWFLLGLASCDVAITSGNPTKVEFETVKSCLWDKTPKGIKKSRESSVIVSLYDGDDYYGGGSGNYFEYRKKRFILTAAHVVSKQGVQIIIPERFGIEKRKANVIFIDRDRDIAILSLEEELQTLEPIKWRLRDYYEVNVGEELYFTGHPLELKYISSRGMVSAINPNVTILQTFAWMGMSGSVLFDSRGRVVGILSAIKVDPVTTPLPQFIESLAFVSNVSSLIDNKKLWNLLNEEE